MAAKVEEKVGHLLLAYNVSVKEKSNGDFTWQCLFLTIFLVFIDVPSLVSLLAPTSHFLTAERRRPECTGE